MIKAHLLMWERVPLALSCRTLHGQSGGDDSKTRFRAGGKKSIMKAISSIHKEAKTDLIFFHLKEVYLQRLSHWLAAIEQLPTQRRKPIISVVFQVKERRPCYHILLKLKKITPETMTPEALAILDPVLVMECTNPKDVGLFICHISSLCERRALTFSRAKEDQEPESY